MLAPFARGIAADRCAVEAALSEPWSNGSTEGLITRLKLIRRQMYGRGKLDRQGGVEVHLRRGSSTANGGEGEAQDPARLRGAAGLQGPKRG